MRLLFIRHADPDYEHGTITDKGIREAGCLADIIEKYHIDEAYVSPLGRAYDTAKSVLLDTDIEPITLEWLREFPARVDPNISKEAREAYANELNMDPATGKYKKHILWDILPSYYGRHPKLFDAKEWRQEPLVKDGDMITIYDDVIHQFDLFVESKGYKKRGYIYDVIDSNEKTIALFCHYGITALLLSHMLNVSPFIMWHFTSMAPTGVSEIITEERQQSIASFRMFRMGDISHLVMADEKASESARFCEMYSNDHQRH